MIINNYAVAMDAQYFNLKRDSLQAEVQSQTDDFANGESNQVDKIETLESPSKANTNELSIELSKAVLHKLNISNSGFPDSMLAPMINPDFNNRNSSDNPIVIQSNYEEQALDFQVKAYIQTDSKEIEVSLDVSLSRSFTHQMSINFDLLTQQLKDPLVLSFDGNMPTLSSETFSFDIDSDGESDQISQLNAGSGFLAFDKNNNSKIDDGNELFGTQSGDGFGDLSEYDDDKNGWIDENDAIFDKLRIWKKDGEKEELLALGEVGVGAIFLGNTSTPFELKSDSNALLGEIKSSGFFLRENGTAGVISQIDLAVNEQTQEELENLKNTQRNSNLFSLINLYNTDSQDTSSAGSTDTLMENLDTKIKNLESKLSSANDDSKPALQSQIAGLQAQKIAILQRQIA